MRTIAVTLLLALPAAAAAHEVRHEVERGRAIAVRATSGHGPLADATFELFSPADPAVPYLAGRTDRAGWVAFVPDRPGAWRVRIVDDGGHGTELTVEADAPAGAPRAAEPPATAAAVLRPLAGVGAIGAFFAAVILLRRRRARAA
jgi:nickel transport protein